MNGLAPRYFFSAVLHDQNVYIFGGTNIFHFSLEGLYQCDLGNFLSFKYSTIKSLKFFFSSFSNEEKEEGKFHQINIYTNI